MAKHIKSPEEISLSERLRNARTAIQDILRREVVTLRREVFTLLTSDSECRTIPDVYKWRDDVVEAVVDMVKQVEGLEMEGSDGLRVCCPLCGGSTQSGLESRLPFRAKNAFVER